MTGDLFYTKTIGGAINAFPIKFEMRTWSIVGNMAFRELGIGNFHSSLGAVFPKNKSRSKNPTRSNFGRRYGVFPSIDYFYPYEALGFQ